MGWLGEFELLKHSRHRVLQKPWASPTAREIMDKYFKLSCAHVEIEWLNIEIPRVQGWVDHDDEDILATAQQLEAWQPLLAAELRDFYCGQHCVNNVLRARLAAIYKLSGYTGPHPIFPEGASDAVEADIGDDDMLFN